MDITWCRSVKSQKRRSMTRKKYLNLVIAFEMTWIKAGENREQDRMNPTVFGEITSPHLGSPGLCPRKKAQEATTTTTCVRFGAVPGRRRRRWRLPISRFARPTRTFIPGAAAPRTAWIIRSDVRRRAPASPGVLWPFDKLRISAKGIIYVCECAADSCPSAHRHRPPVDPNVPRCTHNTNTHRPSNLPTCIYLYYLLAGHHRSCRGGSCPVSRT